VHRAAFGIPGETAEVAEAILTDQLRPGPWFVPELSLVAVRDGSVVGHVIVTRAVLAPAGTPVLGLGPIGVLPTHQGRGVGSALMHAVLGAAEALGEPLVGLLGDPAFYGRFGFVAAATAGVTAPDPAWGAAFQVRTFSAAAPTGAFGYAAPFAALS
jgi:putative acetyltransferase